MAKAKKKKIETVEPEVSPSPQESFEQPYLALLIAVLFLSLLPSLVNPQAEWVFEDAGVAPHELLQQRDVRKILTFPFISTSQGAASAEPKYRPFLFLSLLPFAQQPLAMRALVWLSHLALGLLLFFWVKRGAKDNGWIWPLAAAALFLLHPLGAEVKSQLFGLSETMPILLAGLAFYLGPEHAWWGLILVCLAPGFKESGFFSLIAYAGYLGTQRKLRPALCGGAATLLWMGLYKSAYGHLIIPGVGPYLNPLVEMGFGDALVSRFALLGQAGRVLLFPTDPSSDYSAGTLALPATFFSLATLAGIALLAVLAVSVFRFRRFLKSPPAWFGLPVVAGAMFLNLHVLGVVTGTFSERAWIGPLFVACLAAFTYLAGREWPRPKIKWAALAAVAGLACFYSVLTYQRQAVWVDSLTLFRTDSSVHSGNGRLQYNLGYILGSQKRWEEAKQAFLQSIQNYPEFGESHYRLSLIYNTLGDKENARKHADIAQRLGILVHPSSKN